jgi:uncharacterized protein YPO0396
MQKKIKINPNEAGFRLDYLEIYNWGTFDKQIFRISPSGENSLLTGANGSGKTTLIDAMLTLMVPEKRFRFYNQSSGSQNKKERDEDSYVRGFYGKTIEEGTEKSTTQMLRPDKEKVFSVLLANFVNEYSNQNLTLAQVRWYSGSDLKRTYFISHKALNIVDDIKPFDANGLWKKRLKAKYGKHITTDVVEFFDSPTKYSNEFRKIFGMRSEKALTLFNQTVGIKVLGSLDDFIRHHMLEETNIEDDFIKLKENYQHLLTSHKTIEKAKEQIVYLEKIKENNDTLESITNRLHELNNIREILEPYFLVKRSDLYKQDFELKTESLVRLKNDIEVLKQELESKRENEKEIDFNIKNDETGRLIKELDRDIKEKNRTKNSIDSNVKKYNLLAERLRFHIEPSKDIFYENITHSKERKELISNELILIEKQAMDLFIERNKYFEEREEKLKELKRLESQKNNITGRVSFIREEILQAVGAKQDEIPFIGELIQVKEKDWENSIEKLLHGFALRLLVPDRYYNKVNNFVNKTDLGGRIVYHKVDSKVNTKVRKIESDSLINKIEIKPDSEYFDWLEEFISNNYDYICTNDMEYFSRCSKALTKDGLIKNNTRHEKDDRVESIRKENYVLGWDNKDKLKLQKDLLKILDKKLSEIDTNLAQYEKRKKSINKEKEDISLFLNFDDFESINWKKIVIEIQELESKKQELETTSNKIKALNSQLKEIRDEIKKEELLLTDKTKEEANLENYLNNLDNSLDEISKNLNSYDKSLFKENFDLFELFFEKDNFSLNLKNIEDIYKKRIIKLDSNIEKQKELQILSSDDLRLSMREFKNPSDEDLVKKFTDWRTDTYQLSDDIKYVSDYLDILNKLNEDELPKSQERFKKYLNEDMINKLADFQTILTTQEEAIIENIEALNYSLKKINFRSNPPTYIQIKEVKNTSEVIGAFRMSLKEWKPNISEYEKTKDDSILEKSFLKIQAIIDDLSSNENKRKEVTDVRNWFKFSAREHFREDGKLFKIYESTGELSGGEKAQLTYTILGSSIAYQFGINQDGNESKSFRFITVDESFSNQDDEKATYLMDLCKQLHLQLLVVTPNDKTHIVEPYISHVHFTQRQNNRHSLLFDMPITQYIEERDKWNSND